MPHPTVTAPGQTPAAADPDAALARFAAGGGGDEFARVVAAHGPMVLAVCRRVLRNPADAEDAFQATFLVLARDARTVTGRGLAVGGWLYGTAYRVSLLARRTARRRVLRELRRPAPMPDPAEPNDLIARREAERLVDAELHGLPGKLRQPLVLCYLAGLTHDQAAEQLGVHPRTLERRLKAGLDALRLRLGRRGVLASAAVLVALLSEPRAAAMPPALAAAAAEQAAGPGTAPPAVAGLAQAGAGWGPVATWVGGLAAAGLVAAGVAWQAAGRGPALAPAAVAAAPADAAAGEPAPPPEPAAEIAPVPVPVPAAPAEVTFVPGNTRGQMRPVEVSGRLLDPAGRPMTGVTVAFLMRPVRRAAGGTVEPVPDPLATTFTRRGKFRVLARSVTDAAGRFVLRGERAIPDPATGARLLQMYPMAVDRTDVRFADVQTDFDAVQMLSAGGD